MQKSQSTVLYPHIISTISFLESVQPVSVFLLHVFLLQWNLSIFGSLGNFRGRDSCRVPGSLTFLLSLACAAAFPYAPSSVPRPEILISFSIYRETRIVTLRTRSSATASCVRSPRESAQKATCPVPRGLRMLPLIAEATAGLRYVSRTARTLPVLPNGTRYRYVVKVHSPPLSTASLPQWASGLWVGKT
jgi:hypothetical protein